MRKYLFYLGTLTFWVILFSFQLAAQNTAPYWSLAGNSTASNTLSKLGTTNAINLRLFTNNIERVHINASNGYVGIGTSAPVYKLHVVNTANAIYGTTTGTTSVGVWGNSPYRGVYGNGATGVYGNASTTSGYGVYGHGGKYGVYGTSTVSSGKGVYGNATGSSSAGVYGNNTNSAGYGVYGNSTNYIGVYGSGGVYGLFGQSNSGDGVWGLGGNIGTVGQGGTYGVYGFTDATSGTNYGMYGSNASSTGYGVYGTNNSSSSGYGVYGHANLSSGYGVFGSGYYGVYGDGSNYGVYGFTATSGGDAVHGKATGSSGVGGYFESTSSFAVLGYSTSSIGVYGGSTNSVGVEGFSSNSVGVVGGTGNSASYAGYFTGNVFSTGSYQGSDRKLKQNISDVTGAMDIINKLQPKYYEYRQDGNYKLMNLPQGKHYGLIAQDVEEVLPGLVKETEFDAGKALPKAEAINGNLATRQEKREVINFKALNYTELIPIIVKAMQELNKKNEEVNKENKDLQLKLDVMEKELNEIKAIVKGNNTVADLSISSLEQNTPNPFNSATIIRYHLPENTNSAKVVITDATGRTMKSIALTSRGAGEINLNTGTLAAGSYNYTLWVDGNQVDSKKMVITK